MARIEVPVSAGELVDKLTILEIKSERIADAGKLVNVRRELAGLSAIVDPMLKANAGLAPLKASLRAINETLWESRTISGIASATRISGRSLSNWRAASTAPMTSVPPRSERSTICSAPKSWKRSRIRPTTESLHLSMIFSEKPVPTFSGSCS